MTAPAINGTRYPQPVEDLLPGVRELARELGTLPSRNRLMRQYRIGAPKAEELLTRLRTDRPGAGVDIDRATHDGAGRRAGLVSLVAGSAATAGDPPAVPGSVPPGESSPVPGVKITPGERSVEVTPVGHPDTPAPCVPVRAAVVWPVVLLALPAFVAIWSGWVGLGGLTGFGVVHPLPGIWDSFSLNSAITLPVGVETYGAYALYVWLSGRGPDRARRFAKRSAIASLIVGALGQVAYHLLTAAGVQSAPWWITTLVACLPVAVLGMGAALAHLVRAHH